VYSDEARCRVPAKGEFERADPQTNIMVGDPGTEYVGALQWLPHVTCHSSVGPP